MSLFMVGGAAHAQRDLESYPVFQGKVVPGKEMVVSEANGFVLSDYKLSYYRSVSFTVGPDTFSKVAAMVEIDAVNAPFKETEKVGGMLTYALVQPKSAGKKNRYLCYQARKEEDKWKVTLMYLEGSATLDELRKMFDNQ